MFPSIPQLTQNCLTGWMVGSTDLPRGLPEYTPQQQSENESETQQLLEQAVRSRTRGKIPLDGEQALFRKQVRATVVRFLLQRTDPASNVFMDECEDVARAFVRAAKEFDPAIAENDAVQALRNQWVFNSIQSYLGRPVSMTGASFAYSMLYPYTDNRLDGGGALDDATDAYVQWLSLRLQGQECGTGGVNERTVSRLIGMIEREYPRSAYPDVHRSLLAIHDAQARSLRLHRTRDTKDEAGLLSITIGKGGTSVLADGYLVSGTLAPGMAEVMFAYGVMLQLVDDLQDVEEDRVIRHSTAFTRALESGPLDASTNRLFSFLQWCRAAIVSGATPATFSLCALIAGSCLVLVLESIARHRAHYSATYLAQMEKCMPLPIGFFGTLKSSMERRLAGEFRGHHLERMAHKKTQEQ
jgi:hypothetical protein